MQLKDALGTNLTVSDGASYAFTTSRGSVGSATDNGDGTVSGTLTSSTSAGVATVSATRDGSPFANSVAVTFTPGPATTLEVSAPATATAGSTFSVDVTARDANGNVATGYTGTVAFSGGGAGAQLPANYTFVPGDAGTKTLASVELRQAGSRTITVTDTVTGTITGGDTITVGHGAATQIALSGSTADLTSGATPPADGDDPGRLREHRHLRQLDGRRVREGLRRGHRRRHRQRDRLERRRHQDDHRRSSPAP